LGSLAPGQRCGKSGRTNRFVAEFLGREDGKHDENHHHNDLRTKNGGSDCLSAIAFSAGTFMNSCATKTKMFN
jgi:hypothetical protein